MRLMLRLALLIACIAAPAAAQDQPQIWYRPGLLIQIGVANLDRAIAFYTEVLGFTMTERRNDLKFAHIDTNVPGLQIGLNESPSPKGSGSIVLNISVANVVNTRKQLEARGLKFRGETVIIPGKVALAEFADPDGNVLRFAGPAADVEPAATSIGVQRCRRACARFLDRHMGRPQREGAAGGEERHRAPREWLRRPRALRRGTGSVGRPVRWRGRARVRSDRAARGSNSGPTHGRALPRCADGTRTAPSPTNGASRTPTAVRR